MLKLAVFACLSVLCCAQPPPSPPKLAETFTSSSSIFRKSGPQEMRGSGKWDRSEMEKSFVEISEYQDRDGTKMFFEHLGLFDTHKEYDIMTGDDGQMKCEAHDIPAGAEFPMVWDWLDHAQYHRFEDHRTNKTYDAWSEHSSDGRSRTLLVGESDPVQPVALLSRSHETFYDMRFMSFSPMAPPSSVFMVPPACNPPRPHKQ